MILPDKVYNVMKWLLVTFVPALVTLISALGAIYKFDATTINLTIGAVATFLASILMISNYNYKNKGE